MQVSCHASAPFNGFVGVQENTIITLQHDRSKAIGGVGAGVHADPVGAPHRPIGRRVAVDNNLVEPPVGYQEFVAYPHEVLRHLPIQRNARPDSCMDEHVIPNNMRVFKTPEKLQMLRWAFGCGNALRVSEMASAVSKRGGLTP